MLALGPRISTHFHIGPPRPSRDCAERFRALKYLKIPAFIPPCGRAMGRVEHFVRHEANKSFAESSPAGSASILWQRRSMTTGSTPVSPSALELPELEVAVLSVAELERLFVELAFETTVLGVLVKG